MRYSFRIYIHHIHNNIPKDMASMHDDDETADTHNLLN